MMAFLAVVGTGPRPALAQADRPVTERHDDTLRSAITSPAEDLNLKKTEIPEVLQRASANPYDLARTERCDSIAGEVQQLDAALGPDADNPQPSDDRLITAGGVLKAGVDAVIPFRGVVRMVSGANAYEKQIQQAVDAGFARRGFLKGKAYEMNCAAPAAPAWYRPVEAPPAPTPAVAEVEPLGPPGEHGLGSAAAVRRAGPPLLN